MKKKRRIQIWSLALIVCLSLMAGGCTPGGRTEDKKEDPDLKIGVSKENMPYYYGDSDGKAEGFYVDLMEAVSEKLGYSYEFVEADQENVSELLQSGTCDAWLGTALPDEASGEELLVTEESYQSALYLVTGKKTGISRMKELRGQDIVARSDGAAAEYAAKTAVRYEGTCVTFAEQNEALEDLRQGQAGAAVVDAEVFRCLADADSFTILKTSETLSENHHFTVRKEEEHSTLQAVLDKLEEDGTMQNLRKKYFSPEE